MDIFEKEFNGILIAENVGDTNRYYGDRSIPITNVVFPNGAIDPWHAMGFTEDLSPSAKAIYMKCKMCLFISSPEPKAYR